MLGLGSKCSCKLQEQGCRGIFSSGAGRLWLWWWAPQAVHSALVAFSRTPQINSGAMRALWASTKTFQVKVHASLVITRALQVRGTLCAEALTLAIAQRARLDISSPADMG